MLGVNLEPPRKKGTLTARRIRKRKRYLMVDAPGKEKEKRCVNCRLKPRNQKVEIRNGSWVHSSRSLFWISGFFFSFVPLARDPILGLHLRPQDY